MTASAESLAEELCRTLLRVAVPMYAWIAGARRPLAWLQKASILCVLVLDARTLLLLAQHYLGVSEK